MKHDICNIKHENYIEHGKNAKAAAVPAAAAAAAAAEGPTNENEILGGEDAENEDQ